MPLMPATIGDLIGLKTPDAAGSASSGRSASNLATLLDRFTAAVTNPEAESIGSFAATVDALHGELAMLARHFGAEVHAAQEAIDLDDFYPDEVDYPAVPKSD